jgi:peptidoglycan glycosyltransferase
MIRSCLGVIGVGLILYALLADRRSADERWLAALALGGAMTAAGLWPDLSRVRDLAQRGAVRIGLALTVGFALVAIQLLRMQAINASTTANRSGTDPTTGDVFSNPRSINLATTSPRGAIVDRTGEVLADTTISNGIARRRYSEPATAYVCGYFSPLKYGLSGLEKSRDGALSGRSVGNRLQREWDNLLGRPSTGDDLVLTLDAALQRQAGDLLDGHIGAAVVIEVATGAVLVLASAPNFDPAKLAAVDDASANIAEAYWAKLSADPSRPLLLRATQGLYPPGSTFKTVTASAALDLGLATPDDVFQDNGSLYVDGHVITENNRPDDRVEWTLRDGLAYSLNVVFAQVGMKVGAKNLTEYAQRFGFGTSIPFDVPVAEGQVFGTPGFLDAQSALADTGFGQGQLLTTPFDMALVAATIANGGATMRPYLVARTRDGSGKTTSTTKPSEWRRPISKQTAATMLDLMINDVENGYVYAAAIDGFTVGGKTGTAETNTELPHAWFIGFVGVDTPKYAVSVLLEHGGEGTHDALSIGREMLQSTILKYS